MDGSNNLEILWEGVGEGERGFGVYVYMCRCICIPTDLTATMNIYLYKNKRDRGTDRVRQASHISITSPRRPPPPGGPKTKRQEISSPTIQTRRRDTHSIITIEQRDLILDHTRENLRRDIVWGGLVELDYGG